MGGEGDGSTGGEMLGDAAEGTYEILELAELLVEQGAHVSVGVARLRFFVARDPAVDEPGMRGEVGDHAVVHVVPAVGEAAGTGHFGAGLQGGEGEGVGYHD